jgi:PhnB protein
MEKVNIPEGCNQVMPYLIINNAAGFLQFAKDVFGAVEQTKHMRDEDTIMHAQIGIGDSVIMFADATDEYPSRPVCSYT